MIDELSFVIPAHDEVASIGDLIRECNATGERLFRRHEIVVIDDGSTDGTGALLDEIAARDPRVRVVHHERNLGIADATRSALQSARLETVLYLDGDGQFDPAQVERLLPHLATSDFVIGIRERRCDPLHRRVNAWLYNSTVRTMFRVPFKDVDSGFKLARLSSVRKIELSSSSAFVLAELLLRARDLGLSVREVPVEHRPRRAGRASGGRVSVIARALLELMRAAWRRTFA